MPPPDVPPPDVPPPDAPSPDSPSPAIGPETGPSSGDDATGRRPFRRAKFAVPLLLVGLLLAVLAAWQWRPVSEYVRAAWSQGTLAPQYAGGSDWLEQLAADGEFDFSRLTLPERQIYNGGPGKDAIAALSYPPAVRAEAAAHVAPHERVIGVRLGSEARAYPLKILNYHEIINDRLGDRPIVVTYCPLCDSAAVFDRRTALGEREFGVSGLLYNSNVLMFDRGDGRDNLWSQLAAQGVSGDAAGKALESLPLELTTWHHWLQRHPDSTVVGLETGHPLPYNQNPYPGYLTSPQLMFPARPQSRALPAKSPVLGVWAGEKARAYPVDAFNEQIITIEDQLDGRSLTVEFDPRSKSLRVVEADSEVRWVYSLWFAWYAFRPETEVYSRP